MPDVNHRALMRAHATLTCGTAFVADNACQHVNEAVPERIRARLLGNQLRELDRFLSIIAEEVALSLAEPGHDASAFARLRNTPNKLGLVMAMMGTRSVHHDRLKAIGRISICLHHCSGKIYEPGMQHDVVLAHGYPWMTSMPSPSAEILQLLPQTILRVARLYQEIADQLIDAVEQNRVRVDFMCDSAHA